MQTQANRQTANNVSDVSSRAEQAEAEMKPQFAVGDSLFALTNATQLHSILWSTKCTNEHKNWEAAFEHPLDLPLCRDSCALFDKDCDLWPVSQPILTLFYSYSHSQSIPFTHCMIPSRTNARKYSGNTRVNLFGEPTAGNNLFLHPFLSHSGNLLSIFYPPFSVRRMKHERLRAREFDLRWNGLIDEPRRKNCCIVFRSVQTCDIFSQTIIFCTFAVALSLQFTSCHEETLVH